MKRRLYFLMIAASMTWASTAAAQAPPSVPQHHIPAAVLLEVRSLERQFDVALANDCAPERCSSKGCSYVNHVSVDLPRAGSLPGLGVSEGAGSVPPQEYLTEVRCQFTYEKSVAARDVRALTRRLEQHLSRAWLKVAVAGETLEPIAEGLRESPEPLLPEVKPVVPEAVPTTPPAPPTWDPDVAVREFWLSLLPHFAWMIALIMLTLSTLIFIWAGRRLGRESIEEKMLAAQLAGTQTNDANAPADDSVKANLAASLNANDANLDAANEAAEDPAFVKEQERLWNERFVRSESARDDNAVIQLLRQWLRASEYELLAKAVFVFGDKLSPAFAADPELAVNKVEFAEYLRSVDDKTLLSRTEFFRRLNHHAVSSHLLAQDEVQIYQSLRDEFGATGLTGLMESLLPRHAALLFALLPTDCQLDTAAIMSPELRTAVAAQLLASTRISKEETAYLFDVLRAARSGEELPTPPKPPKIVDRGRELDAAAALSWLLPHIDEPQRGALFARAIEGSRGTPQRWYQNILFGDMLLTLPDDLRKDLLLEMDVRGLAAWLSLQEPDWRQSFVASLAPSMQAALLGSLNFSSRTEQLRLARRGYLELVAAIAKQLARGRVSFAELVSCAP